MKSDIFKSFFVNRLGIDKAIFYTLLGRGLQISTALFTVLFIAKYLSPDEQGYYYTFGSLVAIQVFFELGLTQIITQFVAHEFSQLKLSHDNEIIGDDKSKSRLSSLLRFCAKWYFIFAIVLLAVLLSVGLIYFNKFQVEQIDIIWRLPWVLLALGTSLNLLLAPVIAFIEGLGRVKEVAQLRLLQQIIHPVVIWGGLILGSKLFVSGADSILRIFVVCVIIFRSPFFKILKNIWYCNSHESVNYKAEIFPYQWRIALSWISGYFIFQLFNPVLFASEGPVVAGQMGMTLAALNGLQALTMSWVNTKVPKFSTLIARKEFSLLDSIFNRTLKQMLLIGGVSIMVFLLIIIYIKYSQLFFFHTLGNRFLPLLPLGLMAYSTFTMFPISAWASYLRCHKKEPLLLNSVIMGVLCCCSTLILGKYYGLLGMCVGFAILRTISFAWIYTVYITKKKEWHN